jgi:hypothetical protein
MLNAKLDQAHQGACRGGESVACAEVISMIIPETWTQISRWTSLIPHGEIMNCCAAALFFNIKKCFSH